MIIERIVIAAAIFGILLLGCYAFGCFQRSQASKEARTSQLLDKVAPTILYFRSDMCVPCKTVQTPELEAFKTKVRGVEVVTVDAMREPEVASNWGVMTTPTTIVLDTERKPRFVNNRVVSADKLAEQVASL